MGYTYNRLTGDIVIEYLKQWNDLPSLTLARKIYNENNNYLVFANIEHVRTVIRYYRGKQGDKLRNKMQNGKHPEFTHPTK
jgi:hypothetical protein